MSDNKCISSYPFELTYSVINSICKYFCWECSECSECSECINSKWPKVDPQLNDLINDGNCICIPLICSTTVALDLLTCIPVTCRYCYRKINNNCSCKKKSMVNVIKIDTKNDFIDKETGLPSYQYVQTYIQSENTLIIQSQSQLPLPPAYF